MYVFLVEVKVINLRWSNDERLFLVNDFSFLYVFGGDQVSTERFVLFNLEREKNVKVYKMFTTNTYTLLVICVAN